MGLDGGQRWIERRKKSSYRAHYLPPEFVEDSTLFGFDVYISPHLFGRAILEDDFFSLVNFVFHIKIFNFDVFGSLRAARQIAFMLS